MCVGGGGAEGALKPSRALGTGLTWSYELMKQKPQGAVPGSGWARGAKANSGLCAEVAGCFLGRRPGLIEAPSCAGPKRRRRKCLGR